MTWLLLWLPLCKWETSIKLWAGQRQDQHWTPGWEGPVLTTPPSCILHQWENEAVRHQCTNERMRLYATNVPMYRWGCTPPMYQCTDEAVRHQCANVPMRLYATNVPMYRWGCTPPMYQCTNEAVRHLLPSLAIFPPLPHSPTSFQCIHLFVYLFFGWTGS